MPVLKCSGKATARGKARAWVSVSSLKGPADDVFASVMRPLFLQAQGVTPRSGVTGFLQGHGATLSPASWDQP